jgi:hypothetical protein
MMNDIPSVTRTCPSGLLFKRRNTRRSNSPPNAATSSPLPMATTQKLRPSNVRKATAPKYAPSMKNAPWVRFANRIRPKISENPDASRKSNPPSERLFKDWMIQNCIMAVTRKTVCGERNVCGVRWPASDCSFALPQRNFTRFVFIVAMNYSPHGVVYQVKN